MRGGAKRQWPREEREWLRREGGARVGDRLTGADCAGRSRLRSAAVAFPRGERGTFRLLPEGFTAEGKWSRLWYETSRERAQIRKFSELTGLDPANVAAVRSG